MYGNIKSKAELYGIDYQPSREPILDFKPKWVQDADNQRAVFDYFYHDVIPDESLCIAYAKQVPFIDDNRRVIIGIGHVKRIVPAPEYNYSKGGSLRSMVWETMICHSIRDHHKDGFVIPYQEMMKYSETHPDFDMASITVFAPDDAFEEFSFATEHVSYDSVIDVLLSCINAFTIINNCLDEDYTDVLQWLNEQLSIVWEDRGAFPGLGAMLTAFGFTLGIPMAKEIRNTYDEKSDFWDHVNEVIVDPGSYLTENVLRVVTPILQKTWKSLPGERMELLKLLSRFALNLDQAMTLFNDNQRKKKRIICSDRDILENPYLLYEQTRLKPDNLYLSVQKVDRAVFPVPSIAEKYPLNSPSKLQSDNDERRIRAVSISVLENAAEVGHTFLPCNILTDEIQTLTLEPACLVTPDMIAAVEGFMSEEILKREMKDGTEYYKLTRLQAFDNEIERRVKKRLKAKKIEVEADWRHMLDNKFDNEPAQGITETEELARNEKAAVLKVLAESRLAVLVGDAGTGKTTVLSVLCSHPSIAAGGVMLLAPTGKATVRLTESVGEAAKHYAAYNVAQFLTRSGRFDWGEMRFMLSDKQYTDLPETVIIDEASMLTEEMFGALLQAIGTVKRIILVGDPNQLPPIGSGKPFVDLVNLLRENLPDRSPIDQPRVGPCYGELRINRRQQKEDARLDVSLSRCFTRTEELDDDDDIIAEIIQGGNDNIEISTWETREELEEKILATVAFELGMKDSDDQDGFDRALGATVGQYETFFNRDGAEYVDKWQILAPVKNMPQGVSNINRVFHNKYRDRQMKLSRRTGYRKKIPKAYGSEEIVYGDKVINVRNLSREAFPKSQEAKNYVANGEIGIACGFYAKKNQKANDMLQVCFSSQKGYTYTYDKKDFNDETGEENLELAYALTVHKAQGSQFKTVILILAEPCRIISRELLYTALTRQIGKIIILYNQEPYHLLKYSSEMYSDIARRFTDLFADVFADDGGSHRPQIVKVGESFFDEKLIHKTVRGELVRSKSEVIIANALFYNGLTYEYEPELIVGGRVKRPDFKIIDGDTGDVWYWEHCGMMSDSKYAKRWADKEKYYKKNGIERGKNLIVTEEFSGEGIDSDQIDAIIKETFEL